MEKPADPTLPEKDPITTAVVEDHAVATLNAVLAFDLEEARRHLDHILTAHPKHLSRVMNIWCDIALQELRDSAPTPKNCDRVVTKLMQQETPSKKWAAQFLKARYDMNYDEYVRLVEEFNTLRDRSGYEYTYTLLTLSAGVFTGAVTMQECSPS